LPDLGRPSNIFSRKASVKKGFIASTPEAGSSSEVVERDPGTDGEILQGTVLVSEL